ncbi:MAG: o-succinylbenzoate--CoA ligase [Sciscionella sp.]
MREVVLDGGPAGVAELAGALREALHHGGPPVLPLDAHDPRTPTLRAAMRQEEPVEPDTSVIIATSGSTGEPKGVLLSTRALLTSATATHARLGGPGRWLLATPAQFVGGLQVLVRSMLVGADPVVLDLSAGFRPTEFAAAAAEVLARAGRHYTALVPTQLARLLDAGGESVRAAAGFDAIVLGGATCTAGLRARAEAAGLRVVSAYGMSETASGCVYDGQPLDGVRVRAAGAADGEVGPVELAGDVLANGYRLCGELSASAFAGGWFHTGDLGRLLGDGRLEILGRADDMINTGGVKVAPVLVERVLTGQPGVAEVCVLGVADARWGQRVAAALVPADNAHPPAERRLADAVRAELGGAAVPRRLLVLPELPRIGPGKIDRAALRALLER